MFQLRTSGIEALKERLIKGRERIAQTLEIRLAYLGEQAVTHAKEHKGYKDRTANLKNSISYGLYLDGRLLPEYCVIGKTQDAKSQAQAQKGFEEYAHDMVTAKGFCLIVVAPMEYAKYVETKGYNVLYLTRKFVENRLKEEISKVIEEVSNGKI
jgi:hypothetical protein